jgi:predicted enzyme related to lactoylglutathione lyase
MIKTDWQEILEFYNEVFGTKFKTCAAMRQAAKEQFGSLKECALKLGVSVETLRLQMIKDKEDK